MTKTIFLKYACECFASNRCWVTYAVPYSTREMFHYDYSLKDNDHRLKPSFFALAHSAIKACPHYFPGVACFMLQAFLAHSFDQPCFKMKIVAPFRKKYCFGVAMPSKVMPRWANIEQICFWHLRFQGALTSEMTYRFPKGHQRLLFKKVSFENWARVLLGTWVPTTCL